MQTATARADASVLHLVPSRPSAPSSSGKGLAGCSAAADGAPASARRRTASASPAAAAAWNRDIGAVASRSALPACVIRRLRRGSSRAAKAARSCRARWVGGVVTAMAPSSESGSAAVEGLPQRPCSEPRASAAACRAVGGQLASTWVQCLEHHDLRSSQLTQGGQSFIRVQGEVRNTLHMRTGQASVPHRHPAVGCRQQPAARPAVKMLCYEGPRRASRSSMRPEGRRSCAS